MLASSDIKTEWLNPKPFYSPAVRSSIVPGLVLVVDDVAKCLCAVVAGIEATASRQRKHPKPHRYETIHQLARSYLRETLPPHVSANQKNHHHGLQK